MNQHGVSLLLNDQSGRISDHSTAILTTIAIASALAGTLTITGLTQASGSPQALVVPSTTSGLVAIPGSKLSWGSLSYALSNPADAGKVTVVVVPQ